MGFRRMAGFAGPEVDVAPASRLFICIDAAQRRRAGGSRRCFARDMDRQSLEIITEFGDGGRQPGMWFAVHSIATDSKGNIYTTETYEGKRVQRFLYKGLGPVTKENQGVVWPTTGRTN